MDKQKLMRTCFCFYRDGRFEVRSPFLPFTFGLADTEKEALKDFEEHIDEWVAKWKGAPPQPCAP